jgi:hypothetical protein
VVPIGYACGLEVLDDLEVTFSAREAAALLGRSYSWLDQRVRAGWFTNLAGTLLRPIQTRGGCRRFTVAVLADMALFCYRQG